MVSTMRQRICDASDLPLVLKRDNMHKLDDIKKELVKADKGRVQALLGEAKENAKKLAEDSKDLPVVVYKVINQIGQTSKISSKPIAQENLFYFK